MEVGCFRNLIVGREVVFTAIKSGQVFEQIKQISGINKRME
jgi:hypothetical protein